MTNVEYDYFDYGHRPNLNVGNKGYTKNEEILDLYRKRFANGEIFELDFSKVNKDGDFEIFNGDVKIILPASESTTYGRKYRTYNVGKARKLLQKYQVVVTEINAEELQVKVSHSLAIKRMRDTLKKKIHEKLAQGKEDANIILPAKVVKIDNSKNVVIIDICRYGLYGYIPAARWQHSYVGDLTRVTKPGDQIDVKVLGYRKSPFGKNSVNMFLCSRKELTKDPWIGIEEKYAKNDIVVIECVQIRQKNWFGVIPGLDGIQVFCEYPDASNKAPEGLRVVLGERYQGYIYAVSEERRLLKARVFKHIQRESGIKPEDIGQ